MWCGSWWPGSGWPSGTLLTAALQAITIIGIPLAVANIKMIPVTCFPYGKQVVSTRWR